MTKIIEDTSGLVSIGQLASDAGVTSRTIRYYEELGILPAPSRSVGGTRKYPREYGGYLNAALALKELGFRLEEMKPLVRLAAGRHLSHVQRDTAARLIEEHIEVLTRQIVMLRRLLESVRHPDHTAPAAALLGSQGRLERGEAPSGGEPRETNQPLCSSRDST